MQGLFFVFFLDVILLGICWHSYPMETVTEAFIPSDIQGRGFNVQIFYLEEPVSDYVQSAVSTVLSIHEQVTSEIVYIIIDLLVTTY